MSINTNVGLKLRSFTSDSQEYLDANTRKGELFLVNSSSGTRLGYNFEGKVLITSTSSLVKDGSGQYFLRDPVTNNLVNLQLDTLDNSITSNNEIEIFVSSHETRSNMFSNNGLPIIVRNGYSNFDKYDINDAFRHKWVLQNNLVSSSHTRRGEGLFRNVIQDGELKSRDTVHIYNVNASGTQNNIWLARSFDVYGNSVGSNNAITLVDASITSGDIFNTVNYTINILRNPTDKKYYIKIDRINSNSSGILLHPTQSLPADDRIEILEDGFFFNKVNTGIREVPFGGLSLELSPTNIIPSLSGNIPYPVPRTAVVIKFSNTANSDYYFYKTPSFITQE